MSNEEDRKEARRRFGPDLRGAARKVLQDPAAPLRRTNELLEALMDGSSQVKTDAVRQVGREVRTYLEGLGLDGALKHLVDNYSLEVSATFRLKPLAKALQDEALDEEEGIEPQD